MSTSIRHRLSPIVAIVTLSIGVGFVWTVRMLSSSSDAQLPVARQNESKYDFFSEPRIEKPPPESPTEFSCYDPNLLPVWHELKKDSEFKDRIGDNAGALNCSDLLEVKTVDLNGDGSEEFLVRGKDFQMCSAVGNCGFWIAGKVEKRVRLLLSSSDYNGAYGALGDQIQQSKTHGYSNILLKGHFSATDTSYTTYTFNGRRYEESRCMYEVPKYSRRGEGSMELVACEEFYRRLGKGRSTPSGE